MKTTLHSVPFKEMLWIFLILSILFSACKPSEKSQLDMDNYFAWCIVPFDNQNRTPEERVAMLNELGFTQYAYDWRMEHLPEMAREIALARENDITMNAVWMWLDKNNSVDSLSQANQMVLEALKETGLETQIWVSFPENYFDDIPAETRVDTAVKILSYVATEAESLNCTVGLYNHGGWFGNPENLVAIIEAMPQHTVGIVFNFHHAHPLLDKYEHYVDVMLPHLLAVNLNGMNPDGPKILPIGQGSEEAGMIKVLEEKGYKGPYGILGHVMDADVQAILSTNLEGLKSIQ